MAAQHAVARAAAGALALDAGRWRVLVAQVAVVVRGAAVPLADAGVARVVEGVEWAARRGTARWSRPRLRLQAVVYRQHRCHQRPQPQLHRKLRVPTLAAQL